MTANDVVDLFRLICVLFPQSARNFQGADALARDAWHEMLRDAPAEVVGAAIKKHAATHVFAPSIAEIREAVAAVQNPETQIGPDEAWGMVARAIGRYGYANKAGALASLPAPVARCAERFGWRELCLSETPDVVRGQFRKAYEAQIGRERQDAVIPEGLRQELGRLAAGMGLLLEEGGAP